MIRTINENVAPARKTHRCEECGKSIPKGVKYLHQTNTDDVQIWAYKAHTDCAEFSVEFRTANRLWNAHDEWYPLYDLIDDQNALNAWRGRFPHPVCRIERTLNLN